MKNTLKDSVWNYVKKTNTKSESVAIKKIQSAMYQIEESKIFQQIRVSYMPVEYEKNFWIYIIVKDLNNLDTFFERVCKYSLTTRIYSGDQHNIFTILTNNYGFNKICELFPAYDVRTLFLLHEKSLHILTDETIAKFKYYKLFDAVKNKWKK